MHVGPSESETTLDKQHSRFFCALHALAVHDTGGWTGFTLGLLTAFHIESVMHLPQRAVPAPLTEVAVHRTARWQVLGDVAPLAAGAQHIHHAVDHLAHVNRALAATALGRRDQRLDLLPLQVGEIARVAQPVTVIAAAVLGRPPRTTSESMPHNESQVTRALQAAVPPTGNRFK